MRMRCWFFRLELDLQSHNSPPTRMFSRVVLIAAIAAGVLLLLVLGLWATDLVITIDLNDVFACSK